MMDTPCSTAAQNATVLEDMASKQGGVGDPHDADGNLKAKKLRDIANHIILLFGDLGVSKCVASLLGSRSEERTR